MITKGTGAGRIRHQLEAIQLQCGLRKKLERSTLWNEEAEQKFRVWLSSGARSMSQNQVQDVPEREEAFDQALVVRSSEEIDALTAKQLVQYALEVLAKNSGSNDVFLESIMKELYSRL